MTAPFLDVWVNFYVIAIINISTNENVAISDCIFTYWGLILYSSLYFQHRKTRKELILVIVKK